MSTEPDNGIFLQQLDGAAVEGLLKQEVFTVGDCEGQENHHPVVAPESPPLVSLPVPQLETYQFLPNLLGASTNALIPYQLPIQQPMGYGGQEFPGGGNMLLTVMAMVNQSNQESIRTAITTATSSMTEQFAGIVQTMHANNLELIDKIMSRQNAPQEVNTEKSEPGPIRHAETSSNLKSRQGFGKNPRELVKYQSKPIGKGEGFDENTGKFAYFACLWCNARSSDRPGVKKHYQMVHEKKEEKSKK